MGCCGSKEVQEKPKEVAKPPPKKATPREVVEKKIDPRIVRQQAIAKIREAPQQYSLCTAKGDVKPCFEEGLVFRIIDGDKWYFYNDTMEYDAHVEYRFGPGSEITPGPKTTVEKLDDGWTLARVVVPPLETEHFITGRVNGYKSGITLKPVDVEYLRQIAEGPNEEAAEQLRTVKELVGENADDETALRRCVETRTPFVDIAFPPTLEMLCRKGIDKRYIPPMALKRPTQYLDSSMRNQTEYFRGPVLPQCVEPGHLGDCWLMGTAATLAEKPEVVQNIFRNGTAEERAVGAYRVAVSKHGWWKNVIIDNFLPTINNVPVYGRSIDEPRELWVSFFQKAYAKLHGSYASITGGDALQALQDFTGAPTFRFDKEWEAAAKNAQTAKDLTDKLKHYSEAGYTVVLNTPGVDSETYLGSKQKDMGLDAFIAKYAEHGLQISYTYFVERVVTVSVAGKETVLLKLRNPWKVKTLWNGRWANDSEEWRANPSAAALCKPKGELDHGCFWIEWKDASNYFDGGGVAFVNDSPNLVDYRIKGQFRATHPNVVLEVVAAEPVEVTLMLSQKDKRGQYIHNADANYAPLMLSVARHEGEKLRVERNTSWDPEHPSTDYNFVVSRDVAMRQTFQPGQPYLVVPRLHRRGVLEEGQTRDFVIGILANKSLEGKLKVSIRHLDESNRVFKNILTFPATGLSTAEAEHQVRVGAGLATTTVSSVVSNAAVAGLTTASEPAAESAPVDAEPAEAQPEVLTEAPEPHTNEPPQAMIPTPVNDEEKPAE